MTSSRHVREKELELVDWIIAAIDTGTSSKPETIAALAKLRRQI